MRKIPKKKDRKLELLEKAQLLQKLQDELKSRERSKNGFLYYCPRVWPGYKDYKHHKFIAEILQKAINREKGYTRIVIHEPPQHGKSLQISTLFPSWYIGNNPDDSIIITAYADDHASTFSRRIRNIVNSKGYQNIFEGLSLSQDSKAANRWELNHPHHGSMCAAGINGQITGKGAKLIIIDDPIKNREIAYSALEREKQKDFFKTTLYTRLHDDGIIILIMTRWHFDDLAGYLIANHGFSYICLPAIAGENDPMHREEGEALCPEMYPIPVLTDKKLTLGSFEFESLYQGRPLKDEGGIFRREYFKIVESAPKRLSWVRFWDLATSESQRADYTASLRGAMDEEANVYLDGMIRGQWQWPIVRKKIKAIAKMEKETLVGIESQGPQKGMVQECWSDPELVNVGILGMPVPLSKRIRAASAAARGEAGKLFLVRGHWNEEFISECTQFDAGEHDDQVDAMSGVFHMLGMSYAGAEALEKQLDLGSEERMTEEEFIASTYLEGIDFEEMGEFDDYVTPITDLL